MKGVMEDIGLSLFGILCTRGNYLNVFKHSTRIEC